jgi:hypothetical protein
MKLEDIHTCEKSKGKIVCIAIDKLGNTYCSYCNEKVDYGPISKELISEWKKKCQ